MDEIKGIARVKFHPGKLDEWKRLTEQAMEIVRTRDPGTVQYAMFFNDDESEAIVFERYRDADAALEHFANIGHLMEPLMATATVTGEVLGTPNEMMRAQPRHTVGDGSESGLGVAEPDFGDVGHDEVIKAAGDELVDESSRAATDVDRAVFGCDAGPLEHGQ
jgi:quinol monooxygenase YgiN